MIIRLKKTDDGAVLTCIREDGTVAVQRSAQGAFFAIHDLMHYAVETMLGFRRAFWGLMAEGWEFETFGDRNDARYREMPAEAGWAEHIVGILSQEYGAGAWRDVELLGLWTEDVNRQLGAALGAGGLPGLVIEAGQLAAIYRKFEELTTEWMKVEAGEHLELRFPVEN